MRSFVIVALLFVCASIAINSSIQHQLLKQAHKCEVSVSSKSISLEVALAKNPKSICLSAEEHSFCGKISKSTSIFGQSIESPSTITISKGCTQSSMFSVSNGAELKISNVKLNSIGKRTFEVESGSRLIVDYAEIENAGDPCLECGGSILNHGYLVVNHTKFMGNVAFNGGAVCTLGTASTLYIDNSTFIANKALLNCPNPLRQNTAVNLKLARQNQSPLVSVPRPQGFTFTSYGSGGAVFAENSSLVSIERSSFYMNYADYNYETEYGGGGAVYVMRTIAQITSTEFKGNAELGDNGGGIAASLNVELTITKSLFDMNHNGAVLVTSASSSLVVSETLFRKNDVVYSGGAIWTGAAIVEITNSTFEQNLSYGNDTFFIQMGAGLFLVGSEAVVRNCVFRKNVAFAGGAIGLTYGANLVASLSHFSENSADFAGGAIVEDRSTMSFSGCTFHRNSAPTGSVLASIPYLYSNGSIGYFPLSASFEGCTIQSNSAVYGGFAIGNNRTTTLSFDGCDISRNTATQGAFILSDSETTVPQIFLTNSEVKQNTAALDGGAFYLSPAQVFLSTTRVSGNTADRFGGAFFVEGTTTIDSDCSDMRTNSATQGGIVFCDGGAQVRLGDQSCPNKFQGQPDNAVCVDGTCDIMIGGAACDCAGAHVC